MSFAELAFRISTVRALRGRTSVGENVFDEPVDPLDHVLAGSDGEETARPVIAVYTNQSVMKPMGNDLLNSENKIEITIQIYLPYVVAGAGGVRLSGRDAGGKLQTDMIVRQILRVFVHDISAWAELRRNLCFQYEEVRVQSFIMATASKYEVAARELVFKCELVSEPNFGLPAEGHFARFLELVNADPQLQPLHAMLTAELEAPDTSQAWQAVMAELGSTSQGANGIGLTLGLMPLPEDAPLLDEITVTDEDGDGDFVIDDGTHDVR